MREDTPLPFARKSPGATQELDPNDILEVQDMAAAIARAEKLVANPPGPLRSSQTLLPAASPSSSGDIFESLGRRPTDDTAGPATPAPAGVLTPIPPAYATPMPAAAPAPTPSTPRYLTMPFAPTSSPTALEDDAFYHPLGRMRSLADQTLDGYRPEPTLLVRAASRRKRFSWLFVAALLPLLALAGIAAFASTDATSGSAIASSSARPRTPSVSPPSKLPLMTTSALSRAKTTTAAEPAALAAPATPAAGTPVFDVNSLPTAGSRTKR